MHPTTCLDVQRGVRPSAAQPPPVHHRSLPSQSPWKTQCAQSNQNWLNAPPWNVTVSTECGKRVVLALVPISGNTVLSPDWILGPSGLYPGQGASQAHRWWQHLTPQRGLFRVQETATLEVKFLDRCKINSGEGVLQGHVH